MRRGSAPAVTIWPLDFPHRGSTCDGLATRSIYLCLCVPFGLFLCAERNEKKAVFRGLSVAREVRPLLRAWRFSVALERRAAHSGWHVRRGGWQHSSRMDAIVAAHWPDRADSRHRPPLLRALRVKDLWRRCKRPSVAVCGFRRPTRRFFRPAPVPRFCTKAWTSHGAPVTWPRGRTLVPASTRVSRTPPFFSVEFIDATTRECVPPSQEQRRPRSGFGTRCPQAPQGSAGRSGRGLLRPAAE
jgi:hypothetical protein